MLRQPCLNGGSCYDLVNDYLCSCINDYIVSCDIRPLLHTCMSSAFMLCDMLINFAVFSARPFITRLIYIIILFPAGCLIKIFLYILVSAVYVYQCSLLSLQGKDCDYDLNACRSTPCHNGGTCLNENGNFFCECPVGFIDFDCLTDEDECEVGRCVEAHSYNCTVSDEWEVTRSAWNTILLIGVLQSILFLCVELSWRLRLLL